MEAILDNYVTCNKVKEDYCSTFFFFPRRTAIRGTVAVSIGTNAFRPSSPKRHPAVRQALRMAHALHPDHAVTLSLTRFQPTGSLEYHVTRG